VRRTIAEWPIVLGAVGIYGLMGAAFLAWQAWRGYELPLLPTWTDVALGLLMALPLLLINLPLVHRTEGQQGMLKPLDDLKDRVVKPLADALPPHSAFIVSLSAGVGEELFFHGMIQTELGIIAANVLFALAHFGPVLRQFAAIAPLYFLIGVYFSLQIVFFDSIWVPIVAHAAYDWAVLLYVRYAYTAPVPHG